MNAMGLLDRMQRGATVKGRLRRAYFLREPGVLRSIRIQRSMIGPLVKWGFVNETLWSGDILTYEITPEGYKAAREWAVAQTYRRNYAKILNNVLTVTDAYRVSMQPDKPGAFVHDWYAFIYPASEPLIYAGHFHFLREAQAEIIEAMHDLNFRPDRKPDSGWSYLHMTRKPDHSKSIAVRAVSPVGESDGTR